jgi:hypothetical protein
MTVLRYITNMTFLDKISPINRRLTKFHQYDADLISINMIFRLNITKYDVVGLEILTHNDVVRLNITNVAL